MSDSYEAWERDQVEAANAEMHDIAVPAIVGQFTAKKVEIDQIDDEKISYYDTIIDDVLERVSTTPYGCCVHLGETSIVPTFVPYFPKGDLELYCQSCFDIYMRLAKSMMRPCPLCDSGSVVVAATMTGTNYLGVAIFMCDKCSLEHMHSDFESP